MKILILTDLTRFAKPDTVCAALVDPETGECFRPLPYLTSKFCVDNNLQPGSKVLGSLTLRKGCTLPHVEDADYETLEFTGPSTADEFRSVLEKTLFPTISEGFGCHSGTDQKHIPEGSTVVRSILTIKVSPRQIQIHEDKYKPGKIKLSFRDQSGHHFRYLPITDRGFYDFAQNHRDDSELPKLQRYLECQSDIYLRIGLSRSYKAPDERSGYWLQVNGIYSFPNYPKEIRQYL